MKIRFDKTNTITMIALAVVIGLIALFVPFQCAKSQTAGTLTNSIDYTERQDAVLTEQYGDWQKVVKSNWREAYRNLLSTAREGYKARRASLFDAEELEKYLTQTESRQVNRALDSARARQAAEIEQRRIADSIAATQTQGSLIAPAEEQPERYAANIGKALSPRMLFLEGVEETGGPTMRHGLERGLGEAMAKIAVYGIIGIVATAVILYFVLK